MSSKIPNPDTTSPDTRSVDRHKNIGRTDVKGIYKKARTGKIAAFAGISAPYEVPTKPGIAVDTGSHELESCAQQLNELIVQRGVISSDNHSDRIGIKA